MSPVLVLFSVTVSEGCGALFCCGCGGFTGTGFGASLAWLMLELIGLTMLERIGAARRSLSRSGRVGNLW